MQSSSIRLEDISQPERLREAFLRAARGKWGRLEVQAFASTWQEKLVDLRSRLLEETWRPEGFHRFIIHEPKERVIHAPNFADRVVHHALVDAAGADFERWLIDDSYACRCGRGQSAALRRAETFAGKHGWFLKLDVAKYFDSIPHDRLLETLGARFRNKGVVRLWEHLVLGYLHSPGAGIPIGSLISQMLGNFYLMPVDRLCREDLKVPGYVRYMDDMALWGERHQLKEAKVAVEALLVKGLGLKLKANWHLHSVQRGMEFLGMRVFPGGSQLTRRSRRRFLRAWAGGTDAWQRGELDDAAWQRSLGSLVSHVQLAKRETILRRLF